mmetsp:Transcript_30492/g.58707  ORF Transcript_30492/g.58707 Transcript_30492/m.58707 type:complete len:222 (-) Transcript_30492:529-1194(-)
MDEEDTEAYGGDLPEELEGELDGEYDATEKPDEEAELLAIKQRMQENEDELAKLRQMQTKLDKDMTVAGQPAGVSDADAVDRQEADSRSIYIGNVDYSTTPEELQQLFQSCGTVNRVTILSDKFENPKGFAYLEFLEADAVTTAVQLAGTELHGRPLKVSAKRTNQPGMKAGRGRGRGRGRSGFGGYPGFGMMPMMMPMMPFAGRGYRGRGRGRGRGYSPY